ncbi:hypothetical protein DINM_021297 [Dirofilaria immitis]|nr:hypothetical protein [Dirofilaria immitis]
MSTAEESQKCGQKTALSIFFLLELIAYIFGCIALISPSWQYVYLENGRTEHHHGLWLDCKRDYSHDYGRSREYYETLYRLNRQQSPFDQFFLTSLLCVYKFDYYIDTEDLYDHNHDENRLQDDANQHLLLGWKIASLAALGFAALTASAALLLSICSFVIALLFVLQLFLSLFLVALLSFMGLLIFYIWANYQDNNIIKEEDGVYQSFTGWCANGVVVVLLLDTQELLSTNTTSEPFTVFRMGVVYANSRDGDAVYCIFLRLCCYFNGIQKSRTELVKIEVADRDNSTLLDRTFSSPFKRSFSAVYRLDSSALQKWEKDYMNIVQSNSITKRRAISVPNFKKYSRKGQHSSQENKITKSTSNLCTSIDQSNLSINSETFSSTTKIPLSFSIPLPKSILKASSKQFSTISNVNQQLSDDSLTYEYLPVDFIRNSRSTGTVNKAFMTIFDDTNAFDQIKDVPNQRTHSESSINVYDKVYEHIAGKPHSREQANDYHKNIAICADKISISSEQKQANYEDSGRSTFINDVPSSLSASSSKLAFAHSIPETITVPTDCCASTDLRENLPVPSNDVFMASRFDSDKTLATMYAGMQPSAATSNLRDFL